MSLVVWSLIGPYSIFGLPQTGSSDAKDRSLVKTLLKRSFLIECRGTLATASLAGNGDLLTVAHVIDACSRDKNIYLNEFELSKDNSILLRKRIQISPGLFTIKKGLATISKFKTPLKITSKAAGLCFGFTKLIRDRDDELATKAITAIKNFSYLETNQANIDPRLSLLILNRLAPNPGIFTAADAIYIKNIAGQNIPKVSLPTWKAPIKNHNGIEFFIAKAASKLSEGGNWILSDCPGSNGSSGSAIFNENGQVIGLGEGVQNSLIRKLRQSFGIGLLRMRPYSHGEL